MFNTTKVDLTALAKESLIEKGFIPDFSPAINAELASFHLPTENNLPSNTKDLRKLLWFSLDNDESRDLDQLTYAAKLPENKIKIYVAVANVAYLVEKESAIDNRAEQNTTSIYTPTKVFPMLPEKLSTDLTSLNPNVDRLALVFEGTYTSDFQLESYDVSIALVHNYAKLAYNSISAWLDKKGPEPVIVTKIPGLEDQIRLQDDIAFKLSYNLHQHGALSFETVEACPIVRDGVPISIDKTVTNRGRKLIESLMVSSNIIAAKFSEDHKIPSIQRVVTQPRRWEKIVAIASEKGTHLPETPDAIPLEKFLLEQKKIDSSTFSDLSLTIIKLLGNGEYKVKQPGVEPIGHFGLALKDYSHATAPNRRYPDLVTQRLILSVLQKQPLPYTLEELAELAKHCTQKEDDAAKVERQAKKSAAAMLLSSSIGKTYRAIITGVSDKGTWVRLLDPPVEGKLTQGANDLDVGDRLDVELLHTDVVSGFIDFARI